MDQQEYNMAYNTHVLLEQIIHELREIKCELIEMNKSPIEKSLEKLAKVELIDA